MLNLMAEMKAVYSAYNNTIFPLSLGLIAMGYLLVKARKEQRDLLIYELVVLFTLTIPGIANILWKYKYGAGNVDRIWGIWVPAILCGIVATEIYLDQKNKMEKIAVILLVVVLQLFGVGLDFSGNHISLYANTARVNAEVADIAKELKGAEVTNQADYGVVRMLAPREVAAAARECNPDITVLYDEALGYTPWNPKQLLTEADAYASNCLVISREYEEYGYEEYYLEAGFVKLLQTDNYVVYTR